ncbi:restriction endonuclease subunit M/S [Rhizobium leguminosarum bv. viciae]|uniref:N-6 DNA methylase n=1 Tax=Rhizobium leguminosarum TaxID=384 RepID=UPI001038F997|nr:N-6 DNA methylase [Rhizobium leguminosarum]MBY5342170.1 N-6 DNA methylase [Rhizobium leguminosarum]NKK50642.1 N-6 DNA methylase [Rhizobium leguminosarum bv. viciae]TBY88064.1 restriction endonuclease subunit M/S [Rhizobium leguminosarum bv. viciae]
MLDKDTKRRIDTCRDILVGKVPDPKSQVEQITVALIYKFMDDMDLEAEELGGERKFFTQDYERYRWAKLVAPGVSGQEMLNTYSEALTKMVENDHLPALFRSIFRNAYLPYRDPETLRSFLREIDSFTYDHSERLGDAFEYLLSVLGSQGDAGQFRTPRHIIDFMVEIIDPKKNEVILDPACGTAGFLISAYKHILKANSSYVVNGNGKHEEADAAEQALESPMRFPGDQLSPEDRSRLAGNIKGYDISPDMVRLSLVNLYLHGFVDPKVEEYDTLTSEEKWTRTADVILANPPFMSPKGGIKPHTRFQVQSKRSEVLFVDYIAEHLNPNGRAAIVVPEGIIFQSQSAYVALRKMLVENHLAAVVSLPAGVFNPYSGVKTSILILDRAAAKASEHIAFFKIENDGFQLGAQRKAQKGSQLPQVKAELTAWLQAARAGRGEQVNGNFGFVVPREMLSNGSDYNLSAERYRPTEESTSHWPIVKIGEVCKIARGASPRPINDFMTDSPGGVNWIKIGDAPVGAKYITSTKEKVTPAGAEKSRYVRPGDFLLSNSMSFGRPYIMATDGCIHDGWLLLRLKDTSLTDQDYLYHILGSSSVYDQFARQATGGVVNNLNSSIVASVEIPLPSIEVQREIVAEIEGYQRVIEGARAVVDNYRPHIPVDPEWPVPSMGEIADFKNGLNFTRSEDGEPLRIVGVSDFQSNWLVPSDSLSSIQLDAAVGADYLLQPGDVLFVRSNGNPDLVGRSMLVPDEIGRASFSGFTIRARFDTSKASPRYLAHFFKTPLFAERMKTIGQGANIRNLSQGILSELQVPLPDLETQRAIVAEIEAERALVNGNRDLIARFEKKIDAAIARVWVEAKVEGAA